MSRPKRVPSTEHSEGYEWEIRVTNNDFFHQPFHHEPVTVYAWDLPSALRKAAEIPIPQYFKEDEW